jgi:hypothetical protein
VSSRKPLVALSATADQVSCCSFTIAPTIEPKISTGAHASSIPSASALNDFVGAGRPAPASRR